MFMRQYETITLVDPRKGAEGVEKVVSRMREALEKTNAREVRYENWGRKTTAYRLQTYRTNKAYYLYLNYLGQNTTVAELERLLKITEEAMLYQTVMVQDRVQAADFDFDEQSAAQTAYAKSEDEINYDEPVEDPVEEEAVEAAAEEAPAEEAVEAAAEEAPAEEAVEAAPAEEAVEAAAEEAPAEEAVEAAAEEAPAEAADKEEA